MSTAHDTTNEKSVIYPRINAWSGREVVKNLKARVNHEFQPIEEMKAKTYEVPQWVGSTLFIVALAQFSFSLAKNMATGYTTGAQISGFLGLSSQFFGVVEALAFTTFQLSMLSISAVIGFFLFKFVDKKHVKWPMLLVGVPAFLVSILANLAWAFGSQNGADGSLLVEFYKAFSGRNYGGIQWTVNILISFATEFSLFLIPLIMVYLNTPRRERKESKRLVKKLKLKEKSKKEMGIAIADRDETENQAQSEAFLIEQSRTRKTNRINAKDTLKSERQIIIDYMFNNAQSGYILALIRGALYWAFGWHNVPKGYIEQVQGSGSKKQ